MSTWAPRARARWRAASSSALLGTGTRRSRPATCSESASVGTPASRASTRGCARRAVGTARRGDVGGQFHLVLRGLVVWPTLWDSCVDEPSPFIRLSRADVVAANHQVGRPVLAIGPIHHLGDELTRKTRLGRSQRTAPQPGELRPAPRGRAAYERCGTSG